MLLRIGLKKDFKKSLKRGLKEDLLKEVVLLLGNKGKLPSKYKPHKLSGNYVGTWECHIQPDWLLIWEQNEEIKLISLIRTGTHSDLF
ncbi:type II toxin-antitoxin system mRNA interferase toxin, RelE/StbE family [Avrilella dinanensis]|uniref:Type II toxin-antitoxin system mRNA interferase toxin, RelE/StbE family n=1 Tax=Avrilella dinanensis TaxID=2008672 RepID=A0A2M9R5P2_9FLAO|nr:type II toxin-antitoxin system mRNA interferase toxin, RelE/StbE family [Avrilella dinanensis]